MAADRHCFRWRAAPGALAWSLAATAWMFGTAGAAEPAISADWDGSWAMIPEVIAPQLEACCMGPGTSVPLTPKYRAVRDAHIAGKNEGKAGAGSNSSSCRPVGMPGVMVHPTLFEILFTRKRATVIFISGEVRHVWFGREHPADDDLEYTLEGDSIGKWDKKAMVVDTVGMAPQSEMFMANGIHATAKSHVVERWTLEDASNLRIDVTVTDPEIFTAPYQYVVRYRKVPGGFEVGCDNRDDGVNPPNYEVPAF